MDEKAIKNWLDIAPQYIGFVLTFLKSPPTALKGVKGSSKISSDLVLIMLGAIALSYLLLVSLSSPQLRADSGNVVGFLPGLDRNSLPAVALILTVCLAVAGHGLVALWERIYAVLAPGNSDYNLGGTVEDSVNAALAVAAVFVPAATTAIIVASWAPPKAILIITGVGPALLPLVYFPWALSATHPNTTLRQALFATAVAFALGMVILEYA